MKKFTWLGTITAIIIGIVTCFVGCNDDVNTKVQYIGKVVHAGTNNPFINLEVKVTNGDKIHCVEYTSTSGEFVLTVRIGDIDGGYYVLVGDASCVTKRIALSGFGRDEVDLGTIEIEGPSIPTVTTKPVSNISDNKASCGGDVTADGRSEVTARGVCWSKFEYPTIDEDHTKNGKGMGEFTSQIIDLERGTTYYVRAYATNKQGTAYGEQLTFSTATGLPQVTTDEVTNISATSAICGGEVAACSGSAITGLGICWSNNTASPTLSNDHTEEVAKIGHFTSMMIGLECNTTYYVRAYALNEKGTNYGETKIFTTLNGMPIVETLDPGENITSYSISVIGNVLDDGGFEIITRGFVYSTLPYPTLENGTNITSGNGIGYFSAEIKNISPTQNTYYIRAYATNSHGTSYGDQVVITPERSEYLSLATMTYGGYTYKIKPLGSMAWQDGYDACQNMVFGGYSDWFMPDEGEVYNIISDVYQKSGSHELYGCCTSSTPNVSLLEIEGEHKIWTSTICSGSKHSSYYIFNYDNTPLGYKYWCLYPYCTSNSYSDSQTHLVFSVRKYRTNNQ